MQKACETKASVRQLDVLLSAFKGDLPNEPLQLLAHWTHLTGSDGAPVESGHREDPEVSAKHDHLLGCKELILVQDLLSHLLQGLAHQVLLGQLHGLAHGGPSKDAIKRRSDEDFVLGDDAAVCHAAFCNRAVCAYVDAEATTSLLRSYGKHAVQEVVVALQGGQQGWLHGYLGLRHQRLPNAFGLSHLFCCEHTHVERRLAACCCEAKVARPCSEKESHTCIFEAASDAGLANNVGYS
mmetsp:Transcript_134735/g.319356  ORF Transcript_134735/g.319356 Transcript_134735/m.319356 type:complete len:239 (-) Transcript_134735:384-1100(-)